MHATIDELRSELAEMRSRIAKLEAGATNAPDRPLRSRRQVLKLAGAAVAGAAAAAAGIAGTAVAGIAASGGNLILGHSRDTLDGNVADLATELDYTGTANVGATFLAQAGTPSSPAAATFPAALAGWTDLAVMPNGVYGLSNVARGGGVVAFNGSNAVGGGPGLYAESRRGYAGQFVVPPGGCSHLYLEPTGTAGAPAPGGHESGELYVDSNGVLYYFNNGAFRAIGGSPGGITTMLSAPIRLLETRVAYEDPSAGQTKPHRKLNNNETFDLPITGQVIGGISVPAGAKAVIGNVTVTGAASAGYLTLYPFGVTRPNTSSVSYGVATTAANGVTVGLSAVGRMAIYCYAQSDVIFDVAGYVM